MAETTFDNFYFRNTGTGSHYDTILTPAPTEWNENLLPTLLADGLSLEGDRLQHQDAIYLTKILDDTSVAEITLSNNSQSILTTTKRSGIVIQLLNIGFQNKFATGVYYWDENIANGQSSFDYTTDSKTHMIQTFTGGGFHSGNIAYGGTYSDATFTIRNFDNTEDVLVASDVKITSEIHEEYLDGFTTEGTDMGAFFSVVTPSGYGLDVSHEERRRMWVLGYNVRNV